MKRLKLVVIGCAVIFIALAVVLSCENGAVDPTEEDLQTLGEAMAIAVGDLTFGVDEPGVTYTGNPESPEGGTVTFSGYTNYGITVNGSFHMKISVSGSTMSVTVNGTINLSGPGAPADSVAFNLTLSVDMSDPDPNNWVITVSGTFTIDGTEFNASGIGDLVLYYLVP